MSARHEDAEHVLVVEIEDGTPTYHLEHPPGCPSVEDDLGGIPMTTHMCMTGAFWNDAGSDALSEKPDEPGRYRVQAWYQGPGWAGSYPIEPEGWIDVLAAVPPSSGGAT